MIYWLGILKSTGGIWKVEIIRSVGCRAFHYYIHVWTYHNIHYVMFNERWLAVIFNVRCVS